MYREKYTCLYSGEDIHLKPGEKYTLTFEGAGLETADHLFMTGETALFYQWKNEPDYPVFYRYIDDALNTQESWKSQYALDMSADFYHYPKVAYHRVMFPPVLSYLGLVNYTDNWIMGISAKAKDLQVEQDGYLRFVFEVRYKHEGIDPASTFEPADEVFTIDIPEGSYEWQKLQLPIKIDASSVVSVGCMVEGENYGGKVFLEMPVSCSENGFNVLADFAPCCGEKPQFYWMGQNLSRKEWPEFEIVLNGSVVHRGELFERCHRYSENEIALKKGSVLPGENTLSIRLISDYRDALAYNIGEIGMVCHDDSFVVAVPEIIRAGEPFAVLVKMEEAGKTLRFSSVGGEIRPVSSLTIEQRGLAALQFVCDVPGASLSFQLACEDMEETCSIKRCVLHQADGVSTGTADVIYINQNDQSFDDYISWYFANQIGNLFTIRQSYRWNGTRTRNDSLWWRVSKLLNDAGVLYAHMMDGRELPGLDLNPSEKSLQGKGFLGRQTHENDGACVYGGGMVDITGNLTAEMYTDMVNRMYRSGKMGEPEFKLGGGHFFQNGRHTVNGAPDVPMDMEAASNAVVSLFRLNAELYPRHTGPSTLFKYFYQAGFKWTGAELMYGPHELIIAAMRGASTCYGNGPIGSHLAVQWSTTPHDTQERFRRYWLSLFICYMQGVDEINTEEGLWHLEEYYQHYHRFSSACVGHLQQQQAFYRYVLSHSRTGTFYTPIAFLHGRFDGWCCFGRGNVWGRQGFTFSDAEKSWDILKWFYPRSVLDSLYIHGCKNQSQGYYSGTPYGSVDIVPIEKDAFADYRLLVAPGYNKATPEDMDKLMQYVSEGGKLIIGWPQLSLTTNRADVVSGKHEYIDHPFAKKLACGENFAEDMWKGMPIHVSLHESEYPVLLRTDAGKPLVYEISIGNGTVYFINTREYVGNNAVYDICTCVLDKVVPVCLAEEKMYAHGNEDVQFTVFDQGNGQKHIYMLATDWYRDPETMRKGELILHENKYFVDVPFGRLVKIVACGERAVWPCKDCDEVLSFDGDSAVVQGEGVAEFFVAVNGTVKTVMVDFTRSTVMRFSVDEILSE